MSANDSTPCALCKKVPARPGKTRCQKCEDHLVALNRKKRHERRAAGLCWCGGDRASDSKECAHHRDLTRSRKKGNQERLRRRGLCIVCGQPHVEKERPCPNCQKRFAARRIATKVEVMGAYGGKCFCCGEANIGFLTIDHIDGGGSRHRRELGKGHNVGGYRMYLWLKRHGYPKEYTCLCWNCNVGRHHNGGICPHIKPVI